LGLWAGPRKSEKEKRREKDCDFCQSKYFNEWREGQGWPGRKTQGENEIMDLVSHQSRSGWKSGRGEGSEKILCKPEIFSHHRGKGGKKFGKGEGKEKRRETRLARSPS